jgi:putative transcriptional regulator
MRDRAGTFEEKGLAGSLLLAHPSMRDDNFRRTVILMSTHGRDGAMGVVLNRPLGKKIGDLSGDFQFSPIASVPVFRGGPVQKEQLILAGWKHQGGGFRLFFGLEPDRAGELAGEEGVQVRGFLGYAGWTKGQLEGEIRKNAWLVSPVAPEVLDLEGGEALWKHLLGGMGWEWKLAADEPGEIGNS